MSRIQALIRPTTPDEAEAERQAARSEWRQQYTPLMFGRHAVVLERVNDDDSTSMHAQFFADSYGDARAAVTGYIHWWTGRNRVREATP